MQNRRNIKIVKRRVNISSPYYSLDGGMTGGDQPKTANPNAISSDLKTKFADKDFFKNLFTKSSYAVNGALLGGTVGLGLSLYKRSNYIVYTFVGGIVGIIATN